MNRVNGVRYLLRNRRRHVDLGRSGACILMSSAASPPVSPVYRRVTKHNTALDFCPSLHSCSLDVCVHHISYHLYQAVHGEVSPNPAEKQSVIIQFALAAGRRPHCV
ncbi:hypothetical protein QTP88_023565 [Uroleucon formosanum]